MTKYLRLIVAISAILILCNLVFGQGQRGKVTELPKSQTTEPREDKFDPCCPPITPQVVADHLKYKGSGGINDPYTLVFDTSMTPFKTQMQNYMNYVNSLNSNYKKLIVGWGLYDQGSGSVPMTYPNGSSPGNNGPVIDDRWIYWTPGGNGPTTAGANFFGTVSNPYPMKVNHWYMIHTGTWLESGKDDKFPGKFFDDKCADNDIFVRIQVELKSVGKSEPTLEVQNSKGKIIRRDPIRQIPK